MTERSTHQPERPSLRGLTGSCWGLFGASLTWVPDEAPGSGRSRQVGDRGRSQPFDGDRPGRVRVIDVAAAQRRPRGAQAPGGRDGSRLR